MKQEITLSLVPEEASNESILKKKILAKLSIQPKDFSGYRIIKRSIDARTRNILINLKLEVYINKQPPAIDFSFHFHHVSKSKQAVIVGAGPAGLLAALQFLESGIKPIIIERGKKVQDRRRDIAVLNKQGFVNPDSNYCFGEGGAGTYSDGKLYTRSIKRGDVEKVLRLFVAHGAGEEILADAHPHIGTNKLPHIIENIRKTIERYGGEFHFETRLSDFHMRGNEIISAVADSVRDGSQREITGNDFILASGHSARDIFRMLYRKNILLELKPFAMGVRAEHPQELIDSIQYHCRTKEEVRIKRKFLPAAAYSLVHQVNGRGVYSFCMCPGGIIAPCATEHGEVVVNGWSPSKRNNPFANSGIVVQIDLEDLAQFSSHGIFAGLEYQAQLEQMAFDAGGRTLSAPAQRMTDFVNGRISLSLPVSSYHPGITSAPLHELLPSSITSRLCEAFKVFGKKMSGYFTSEAVLHAVESRTSSPIRIPRDRETMQHVQIKNLYPVGEGAGYAGGIVSAAIDGQRAAVKIAEKVETLIP